MPISARGSEALRALLDCSILEAFVRVADLGNISAAARSLFIAQSAVSTQMTLLARAAGKPLLERVHGRWILTAAGEVFYRHAAQMLQTVEDLRRELDGVSESDHLTLACTRTIADTILAELIAGFGDAHPEIRLEIIAGNRAEAEQRLASDAVDAALVALPVHGKALRIDVFAEDRLVLVVPAEHPSAGRAEISLEEFIEEPFLTFERGSGVRALLENRLGERFGKLDLRLELNSNDALLHCVAANLGITLLPLAVARAGARAWPIRTIDVRDLDLRRELALVSCEPNARSKSLELFRDWLVHRRSVT